MTIAGWQYSCRGEARAAVAVGPFALDPCQLESPEQAPLSASSAQHPLFGVNDNWGTLIGVHHWLKFSAEPVLSAASIGADTLRYELSWASVEPLPGVRNWAPWDLTYSTMLEAGVRPLIVISGAPCWAAESCGSSSTQTPSADHEDEWKDFAADVAERYPLARALEIGNEPNWTMAGGADPERYARILQLAYAGIKSRVPAMPVLSGGLAPFTQDYRTGELSPTTFLRRAYAAGGIAGSSDAISYHAYPGGGPEGDYLTGIRVQIADLREVMLRAGDAAKPIWITETGVSSTEGFTAEEQATVSAAIYDQFRRMPGIATVLFHRWSDEPGGSYWANTGLVDVDGNPKPVFCALAAARGRPC